MRKTTWTCVALLLAAAARADDAKETFDVRGPSQWKAGETVTETEVIETSTEIGGRRAPATAQESTIVRRCVELGDDGRPSRMLLHVAHWNVGGDRSLEGVTLELRRDGWTLLTRDTEPSRGARGWLMGDLLSPGGSGENVFPDYLPPGAVASGDTWTPAKLGGFARLVRRLGLSADAKDIATKCTLVSAARASAGVSATVEFEASAKSPDAADGAAPARRISVREKGSVEFVAGAWHRAFSETETTDVEIVTAQNGKDVALVSHATTTIRHEPGGEIPSWEPQSAAAAAAPIAFGRTPVRAGDVVTEEGSDSLKFSGRRADCECAPCPVPEDERTTEWTLVRRCVEATADGRSSKDRVFVKEWKHTEGDTTDTSLAGAFFDVTPVGWTRTDAGRELSEVARAWVASRAPAGAEPSLPIAPVPPPPARVEARWFPDTLAASRAEPWGDAFRLEPEHATGHARVQSADIVDGAVVAKMRYETDTPFGGTVGAGEKKITALAGSSSKVAGVVEGPTAAWGQIGERWTQVDTEIYARLDGQVRRLATTRYVSLTVTRGGEMPETPK